MSFLFEGADGKQSRASQHSSLIHIREVAGATFAFLKRCRTLLVLQHNLTLG